MEIKNLAPIDWDKNDPMVGTSHYGTVITSNVATVRKVLGQPAVEINDGEDKSNFTWCMELEDGTVFTLYDWKLYRPINENEPIEFNIGHHKEEDDWKIFQALEAKFLSTPRI